MATCPTCGAPEAINPTGGSTGPTGPDPLELPIHCTGCGAVTTEMDCWDHDAKRIPLRRPLGRLVAAVVMEMGVRV